MGAVKNHFHEELCETAHRQTDDFDFYAYLASDRTVAFSYLNSLLAASSPTARTQAQRAEISYARNICDIARTK